MAGIGGFAVSRNHGGDRFFNPTAIRRHQQLLLQQQLRRPENNTSVDGVAKRSDCGELKAALMMTTSGGDSLSPETETSVSNVDRLIEAVTPSVAAHYCAEVKKELALIVFVVKMSTFCCLSGEIWCIVFMIS